MNVSIRLRNDKVTCEVIGTGRAGFLSLHIGDVGFEFAGYGQSNVDYARQIAGALLNAAEKLERGLQQEAA